ncbi:hypothetical protein [Vibrio phage XZ1]|uniref:Uncharacterized protein n=3 Tax=Schizotequatrovirus TaxID=1198137 RepID=A0A126HH14_9CAUD|nr:putative 12.4 kDa protein [Vibrio phage VH7D]YP_009201295.1 hypothetical protein AVU32_gp192 [Vibrio phage ValKK3]ALP47169.1 hypothetical protein phiGrn1_0184 [Vibrio phage phi-Grn1]ALP47555.1 hypothetical protein phiST2_0315 [Vibrio phage phi-ST2]QBX06019.1 putative 12.4 kDa protein [Vibrio phage Va3]QNJ54644.1 hypothetical protein vBValMR10Z_103 [Vibrio phage vB_ValM_R10Z]QNJ55030.1 hypothetical protein vBValMR11Z_104 [Vibrio phage vB_ValM_R11Z]UOL51420.1 hypothetical protein [Vibrio ph
MQEKPDLLKDDEIVDVVDDQEVQEYLEQINAQRRALIEKEAKRRIKKNSREIKRLRKHAEKCLIEENKAGYIYAIRKLRSITGQTVGDDVLETLWETSREQVLTIVRSFAEAKAGQ